MWSAALVRRTLRPCVGTGWPAVRRGRQRRAAGGLARDTYRHREMGQPRAVRNLHRPAGPCAAARAVPVLTMAGMTIREITVEELKARRDRGEKPLVLDVREDWELQLARIPDVVHVPMK